jgi:hypothetical protein
MTTIQVADVLPGQTIRLPYPTDARIEGWRDGQPGDTADFTVARTSFSSGGRMALVGKVVAYPTSGSEISSVVHVPTDLDVEIVRDYERDSLDLPATGVRGWTRWDERPAAFLPEVDRDAKPADLSTVDRMRGRYAHDADNAADDAIRALRNIAEAAAEAAWALKVGTYDAARYSYGASGSSVLGSEMERYLGALQKLNVALAQAAVVDDLDNFADA